MNYPFVGCFMLLDDSFNPKTLVYLVNMLFTLMYVSRVWDLSIKLPLSRYHCILP